VLEPSVVPPPRLLGVLQPPRASWRFESASPLSGSPAVSPSGLTYVASVEGVVHALDASGSFRWSHGLEGTPIGAPAADEDGQVYVATSARRLYALRPDGQLRWVRFASARIATEPLCEPSGFLYFVGRDQKLYGMTTAGGEPLGRQLGVPVGVGLGRLGAGSVALGTESGEVQIVRRAAPVARLALGASLTAPMFGDGERWFALTSAGLTALDAATRTSVWQTPARRAALSADGRVLVAQVGAELRWLAPATGEERQRVRLPGDVSSGFAVTNAGAALVPMVSGELLVVAPGEARLARVGVGAAPGWAPVWDERSGRVTAAAGAAVVALDLSSWQRPAAANDAPGARQAERIPGLERHAAPESSAGSTGGGA
jgi:outer membrane protein assembly factor BamB